MHDFDAYVASRVRNGTPLLPGSLDSYNLQLVCCPEKHVAELFTTRDVEESWVDIAGSRCDENMSQA